MAGVRECVCFCLTALFSNGACILYLKAAILKEATCFIFSASFFHDNFSSVTELKAPLLIFLLINVLLFIWQRQSVTGSVEH